MSKAILKSIKPYYVYLIFSGLKTLELSKTQPIDDDFDRRVYIYCTKDKKSLNKIPEGYRKIYKEYLGKVCGEFVCDKIFEIDYGIEEGVCFDGEYQKGFEANGDDNNPTCLSLFDLENYLTNNEGYGWHISNLKIYDKPKGLWEFCRNCNPCYGANCEFCKTHGGSRSKMLQRPPQSWCYVEALHGT